MTRKFTSPSPTKLPQQSIETLAQQVADKLGYKAGIDILATAESLGGRIRVGKIGDKDRESGALIAKSISNWTMYLSSLEMPSRDRFTIARNIGHLVLHLPQCRQDNPQVVMQVGRYDPKGEAALKAVDWEATWFAFAFLMPAEEFEKLFKEAGKATCSLRFGVSGLVVRARAQSLGLGEFL